MANIRWKDKAKDTVLGSSSVIPVTTDPTGAAIDKHIELGDMNLPILDPVLQTYTLPTTPDGQTQNIGQEQFITVANTEAVAATAGVAEVFLVTDFDMTCGCEEVVRPLNVDLKQGDTFGINTTGIAALSASTGKITVLGRINDVDTSGFVLGDTLYVSAVTAGEITNIKPASDAFALGVVLKVGVGDGIIYVNTVRGLTDEASLVPAGSTQAFLSADVDGSFFAITDDQGIAAATSQSVVLADDTTLPLPTDWVGIVRTSPIDFQKGLITANLRVETDTTSANERVQLEVYFADNLGVAVDSGSGLPNGTLGVPPAVILNSGLLNFQSTGTIENISLTGLVNSTLTLGVNQRGLFRVLMTKEGTLGGNKTMTLHFGVGEDSIVNAPLQIEAEDVAVDPSSMANVSGTDVQVGMEQLDTAITTAQTASDGIKSATTNVNISAATAPTVGQTLIATSPTAATWQTPAGGGFTSSARANISGAKPSIPTGTITKVQFNGEIYDTDSEYDNVTNYRFTPTETGLYNVSATVRWFDFLSTGVINNIYIYRSGSLYSKNEYKSGVSVNNTISINDVVQITAGQYIEIFVDHAHGSNRQLNDGTSQSHFSVTRIQ